jgi:hypothetical protein
MARLLAVLFLPLIAGFVLARSGATPAQAAQSDPLIVLQVKGKVLADGREVKAQMPVAVDIKIELSPGASLVAITPMQKIQFDGPNFGRVDEILAQTKSSPDPSQAGALSLIYDLFRKGVDIVATRDASRDELLDPWFLRLDTGGPKCVQPPPPPPTLVSQRGQERRYVSIRDVRLNQNSYAQIGSDGKVKWPSDLALQDGASFEISIDGVSSTLSWDIRLAPSGIDSPTELTKWLIDSKCLDQVYALALQLPKSTLGQARRN